MKLNPENLDLKTCLCHKNLEITLKIRASLECRINNKSSFEEGHHMKCVK